MSSSFKPVRCAVSAVNKLAKLDAPGLARKCEGDYLTQLEELASLIHQSSRWQFIMIAGPSASGKTTTSVKLRQLLETRGIRSITISLDDFLYNRDSLPLLPDGTRDFESVDTLDIGLLNRCLEELLTKKSTQLPVFDFVTGNRMKNTQPVTITDSHVVIIEGLHALNPAISQTSLKEYFFKVYISPNCEFVLDDGRVVLDGQNLRLIRRMIRDFKFRGSGPENTFVMWKNVCNGEELYINPFRGEADYVVNSTHLYEPLIYHHDLLPILKDVKADSLYTEKARELVDVLELFDDLSMDIVPPDSMIREFIG